jgi:hypothetical protein
MQFRFKKSAPSIRLLRVRSVARPPGGALSICCRKGTARRIRNRAPLRGSSIGQLNIERIDHMPKPALKASPGLTGEIDAFREKLQAELDRRVEIERPHIPGIPRGAIELCLTRGSWCLCNIIREIENKGK